MSDKAYENAAGRREFLLRALKEAQDNVASIQNELHEVERFMKNWRFFADLESTIQALNSDVQALRDRGAVAAGPHPKRKNSKKEEVAAAAYQIISECNEVMGRTALYNALKERGLTIEGSDPEMVLSTMLWRMRNIIVRIPGGGYWVVDLPSPDGKYQPGDPQKVDLTDTIDEVIHRHEGDIGEGAEGPADPNDPDSWS